MSRLAYYSLPFVIVCYEATPKRDEGARFYVWTGHLSLTTSGSMLESVVMLTDYTQA